MALKVELKPGERILVGESVITNHDQRARFLIEGSAPILRERDIMTAERANTPAKTHLSRGPIDVHGGAIRARSTTSTSRWCATFLQAAPSTRPISTDINNLILTGQMYKALKEAKKLIAYEEGILLDHASRGECLRGGGETNSKSA